MMHLQEAKKYDPEGMFIAPMLKRIINPEPGIKWVILVLWPALRAQSLLYSQHTLTTDCTFLCFLSLHCTGLLAVLWDLRWAQALTYCAYRSGAKIDWNPFFLPSLLGFNVRVTGEGFACISVHSLSYGFAVLLWWRCPLWTRARVRTRWNIPRIQGDGSNFSCDHQGLLLLLCPFTVE